MRNAATKWVANLSIRRKLTMVPAVTTIAMLLTACAVFIVHDVIVIRRELGEWAVAQADVIGANLNAQRTGNVNVPLTSDPTGSLFFLLFHPSHGHISALSPQTTSLRRHEHSLSRFHQDLYFLPATLLRNRKPLSVSTLVAASARKSRVIGPGTLSRFVLARLERGGLKPAAGVAGDADPPAPPMVCLWITQSTSGIGTGRSSRSNSPQGHARRRPGTSAVVRRPVPSRRAQRCPVRTHCQ